MPLSFSFHLALERHVRDGASERVVRQTAMLGTQHQRWANAAQRFANERHRTHVRARASFVVWNYGYRPTEGVVMADAVMRETGTPVACHECGALLRSVEPTIRQGDAWVHFFQERCDRVRAANTAPEPRRRATADDLRRVLARVPAHASLEAIWWDAPDGAADVFAIESVQYIERDGGRAIHLALVEGSEREF